MTVRTGDPQQPAILVYSSIHSTKGQNGAAVFDELGACVGVHVASNATGSKCWATVMGPGVMPKIRSSGRDLTVGVDGAGSPAPKRRGSPAPKRRG